MNPIFIPKNFRKINKDRSKILYCNKSINGKDIRIIECYDKKGSLYRVNVWGICGRLEEFADCFVAVDDDIDPETMEKLRTSLEDIYPKGIKMMFFSPKL